MAKLTKHAEVLSKLHELLQKEAVAQSSIPGTPAAEPKKESVSDKTEHVDKNAVKPEQLSKSQGPEQKPASKTAELGQEILNLIAQKQAEEKKEEKVEEKKAEEKKVEEKVEEKKEEKKADAQQNISGTPEADPKKESVSEKTEHVDKNAVKPENNKPQGPEQEKGKPDAKVAADEEVKKASYELGQKLAALLIKEAQQNSEVELMKEAGRRDFDVLIAQAAQTLQQEEQEKQAAALGAAYCDELMKNAAMEALKQENEQLKKTASELEAKLKNLPEKKEEKVEKLEEKVEKKEDYKKMAEVIVEALKNELSKAAPAAK